MSYQPIHPPQKHVSHDRMQEILAKRAPVNSPIKPVQSDCSTPACSSQSIEWGKPQVMGPGSAMLKSLDGRYRIDRVESQAFVGYTCWALFGGELGLNRRLGVADDSTAAKAICQADADAKAQP